VGLLKDCAGKGADAEKELEARLKGDKANFKAMLNAAGHGNLYAGLEGALFGRFVTSDILARADAAVHVAHAFTVHKLDTEVDYFTVVDDLNRDEETGAAHAGDMELGAGLFYGYVTVDIPLLVSNLTGCDAKDWVKQDSGDAREVLRGLIRAIATVSPGAKLGATAPYALSEFVLLEAGKQQPRALANAYLQALPLRGDPMQSAVDALGKHLQAVDGMYGPTSDSRSASTTRSFDPALGPCRPLDASIDAILNAIFPSAPV
jgi:CRISPR system Cascade subunit CasC